MPQARKTGPNLHGVYRALQTVAFCAACFSTNSAGVTFNREIAPIIYDHCAGCHRPGQSAPFDLLTYEDARKHAADIAKVTGTRYMPPWLPEPGLFRHERRLTDEQIRQIHDWVSAGAPAGDPADLPPAPTFVEGWLLGKPDLVVEMPVAYTLAPEGPDLYRNFVIPAPLGETKYVYAFEFRPRSRSVHHVRIKFDPTRQSRRLSQNERDPGFSGMKTPAKFPPGHMITWVPGQLPAPVPEGLSWALEKDADIVLETHLQRTGKPETIHPQIAFYFTNQPPRRKSILLGLTSELIDIPAGATNHIEERSLLLPADVDVLSVLPHMHFLGKEALAYATLPSGQRATLLTIKDWDFNWQGEYQYRNPVHLPAGSVITMRYRFDNSAENVRNPNQPARRVGYGPQSTDEMAELWLQVIPRRAEDMAVLQKTKRDTNDRETIAYYRKQLQANPNDANVHTALGKVLGPAGQLEEAIRHFQSAIALDSSNAEAFYYLGLSLYTIREWDHAREAFQTVLRIDPNYEKAHDGLGLIYMRLNRPEEAKKQFQRALEINPEDPNAREYLQRFFR